MQGLSNERPHERAAPRLDLDESEGFQLPERFPDGGLAGAERGRNSGLHQPLAGFQLARHDLTHERVPDPVTERLRKVRRMARRHVLKIRSRTARLQVDDQHSTPGSGNARQYDLVRVPLGVAENVIVVFGDAFGNAQFTRTADAGTARVVDVETCLFEYFQECSVRRYPEALSCPSQPHIELAVITTARNVLRREALHVQ